MISRENVEYLKSKLAIESDYAVFIPALYLIQGTLPNICVTYTIHQELCKFYIPLFLVEDNRKDGLNQLISEIERNVKRLHKEKRLL